MTATIERTFDRECERLCIRFANSVDAMDYGGCLAVFSDDAIWDHVTGLFTGHDEILAALSARPENETTRHLCSNIFIEYTGDNRAEGSHYLLLYRGLASGNSGPFHASPPVLGENRDTYVFTNGRWLISKRITRLVLTT